jgi:hypothetical protein
MMLPKRSVAVAKYGEIRRRSDLILASSVERGFAARCVAFSIYDEPICFDVGGVRTERKASERSPSDRQWIKGTLSTSESPVFLTKTETCFAWIITGSIVTIPAALPSVTKTSSRCALTNSVVDRVQQPAWRSAPEQVLTRGSTYAPRSWYVRPPRTNTLV